MNIIKFEPKKNKEKEKAKEQLMEVIDSLKDLVEKGEIHELVVVSLDEAGDLKLHVSCMDLLGAIGMLELGKSTLITEEL